MKKSIHIIFLFCIVINTFGQLPTLDDYNPVWTKPSKDASESMPLGGGDIGCNVWVENGDLLFYFSRSGTFDENNNFPKLGRIRVHLSPTPLTGTKFKQQLFLKDGYVQIQGEENNINCNIKLWVDVFNPVIHLDINSNSKIDVDASYESWRYRDRILRKGESFSNSYKWAAPKGLVTKKDSIAFSSNGILFYHKNEDHTIFDVTVDQQNLDKMKDQLYNPLKNLIYGGYISGSKFKSSNITSGHYRDTDYKAWHLKSVTASKMHQLCIALETSQDKTIDSWKKSVEQSYSQASQNAKSEFKKTTDWWNQYWNRSFIYISSNNKEENDSLFQIGKNYQLFRYMLGCNAFGSYPTKFNGGVFTFDPFYTDTTKKYTPDFRNWGGGTFTAQNQRLVYFPMLKTGDFESMKPQFDFYLRILQNAILRTQTYWGHDGASFTEQIENFGLPNCSEYGWKRPEGYDAGRLYNAWLEYQWDTALEICHMILQCNIYNNENIHSYLPLIESCLTFFDEHYQYLAAKRGSKKLNGDGKLVLYPGSACETYKMTYNSTPTIAALKTVTQELLNLPGDYLTKEKQEHWKAFIKRIPEIPLTQHNGKTCIAPAQLWERINNVEEPQLYPLFPWEIYGVGKPNLDIALNTWKQDPDAIKFRSYIGWKQDNIFAAHLGLKEEAANLTYQKLKDGPFRFSAFWGPGFDWTPDHNWGGSAMIGLQDMLIQNDGKRILLLPAWPADWNVHFKLHAPYGTTVEAEVIDNTVKILNVFPKERKNDIEIIMEQGVSSREQADSF